jgi:uncharacterized membrane protein/glutaredoxin
MITVTLFSRPDCHLCHETESDLESLQAQYPHQLRVVNIDNHPDLKKAYSEQIPVVEVAGYRLKAPISRQQLQVALGSAIERQRRAEAKGWTRSDAFSLWFSRRYDIVISFLVLIYVGLPFMAPILMKAGLETPALLIYRGYSLTCHQLAYRSLFLFGEQAAYPREAARLDGMQTFGEATGLSEGPTDQELLAARWFLGDPEIGYKVALCERDVAIYGAIFLFGILFALTNKRIPQLPWPIWLLVGVLPIAIDGMSQLLSQPPFGFWAFRESTPYVRTLTGFLFGFTTAWLGFPMIEKSMKETRQMLMEKKARLTGEKP